MEPTTQLRPSVGRMEREILPEISLESPAAAVEVMGNLPTITLQEDWETWIGMDAALPSNVEQQGANLRPSSSAPWIQTTSGLFDSELSFPDVPEGLLTDSDIMSTPVINTILDADNLFTSLKDTAPVLSPESESVDDTEELGTGSEDIDKLLLNTFLEGFSDLSGFINEEPVTVQVEPVAVEPMTDPVKASSSKSKGGRAIKRKADEAVEGNSMAPTESQSDHIYASSKVTKLDDIKAETSEIKQAKRRIKNNIASKRSRETRKNKFKDMEQEADELEKKNAELRKKIETLEVVTKQMKQLLIEKMASK